jgi:hypothetical protein
MVFSSLIMVRTTLLFLGRVTRLQLRGVRRWVVIIKIKEMQEAVDSMRVLGGEVEKASTFSKVSMSRAKGCVWLMVLLKMAVF